VVFMRESEHRRQAKLAAALAAASPVQRLRSRKEEDAFYTRLLEDTARRRTKRCACVPPTAVLPTGVWASSTPWLVACGDGRDWLGSCRQTPALHDSMPKQSKHQTYIMQKDG